MERNNSLSADQVFSDAAARANEYCRGGFLRLTLKRARDWRFVSGAWRAWRALRPTVIIARVFRTIFIALTFIERSAALIAAVAITLLILPIISVVAGALAMKSTHRMRRVYSLLHQCEDAARGVVVVFGELEHARIEALSCGRASVTILRKQSPVVCEHIGGSFFAGDERFFFYLRRRAQRDGLELWVIY